MERKNAGGGIKNGLGLLAEKRLNPLGKKNSRGGEALHLIGGPKQELKVSPGIDLYLGRRGKG